MLKQKRFSKMLIYSGAGLLALILLAVAGIQANASQSQKLIAEGKQIFRFDTFGDEDFWGGELRLHEAIAGEELGGVGPGVSPATALEVGLKVDVRALPRSLRRQIRRGQVDLNDPAVTLALLKLLHSFSHLDVRVDRCGNRADLRLAGAATFLGLPKLAAAIESVPMDVELHLHLEKLEYVDHACLDLIATTKALRERAGSALVVEIEDLQQRLYRRTPVVSGAVA